MARFIFKKEDNLIHEDDYQEIELTRDISANTLKTISKNSVIRIRNKDGEFEEIFSKEEYQAAMIMHCCKFDGKQLSKVDILRFDKDFFLKLFLLLTQEKEQVLSEQENLEKW